jgi:hypothetical protein
MMKFCTNFLIATFCCALLSTEVHAQATGKNASKPAAGKAATKTKTQPQPNKAANSQPAAPEVSPITPAKSTNTSFAPQAATTYLGIPLNEIFGMLNPIKATDALNGPGSFPVVLLPIKNESGFVPDLHRVYKNLSSSLHPSDIDNRYLVVFDEPGMPNALLVRDGKLLRRLYELPEFQNDTIRYMQFSNAALLGSSPFVYKNRGVKAAEFAKKLQVAVDEENQRLPVQRHTPLMMTAPIDAN